MREKVISK